MEKNIQEQKIEMNLHDLNKTVIAALPALSKEELNAKTKEILSFVRGVSDTYFMLLSNEKRDFTIFKAVIKNEKLISELLEVIENRGIIKAIDAVNGAFEIWIDDSFYAFFPYDLGVVEVS